MKELEKAYYRGQLIGLFVPGINGITRQHMLMSAMSYAEDIPDFTYQLTLKPSYINLIEKEGWEEIIVSHKEADGSNDFWMCVLHKHNHMPIVIACYEGCVWYYHDYLRAVSPLLLKDLNESCF